MPTVSTSITIARPSLIEIQLIDKVLLQAATSIKQAHHKGHSISFYLTYMNIQEELLHYPTVAAFALALA